MKRAFGKLLRAKLPGVDNDDYMLDDPKEVGFQDDLYKYLKEKYSIPHNMSVNHLK